MNLRGPYGETLGLFLKAVRFSVSHSSCLLGTFSSSKCLMQDRRAGTPIGDPELVFRIRSAPFAQGENFNDGSRSDFAGCENGPTQPTLASLSEVIAKAVLMNFVITSHMYKIEFASAPEAFDSGNFSDHLI